MGTQHNIFEIYGQSVWARAPKKVRQPWYRTNGGAVDWSQQSSVSNRYCNRQLHGIILKQILRISFNVLLPFTLHSPSLLSPSQPLSAFISLLLFSLQYRHASLNDGDTF